MHRSAPKFSILIALILFLALPISGMASEETDASEKAKEVLVDHLKPNIEHLLSLADDKGAIPFDASQAGPMIEFVTQSKTPGKTYTFGSRNGGTSAYYEFTLKRSLKDILSLAYSDTIPTYVTAPSSIRVAHWIKIDGKEQGLPNLGELIDDLASPKMVKGVEYVENTPDATSGAYYAYLLDRTMILMKYKGHQVMLSISNQKDKSNVGKKGLVLGADQNWNYLYTGEKGCTKPGFGWADSYMYHSSSIIVYYQTNDPVPQVKCGTFKWLKAGWAGINLAQPFHLRDGMVRFASTYKEVVESPALAEVPKISRMFEIFNTLTTEELREKSRLYLDHLAQRHLNDSKLTRKYLSTIPKDENYIESMSREEMMAIVIMEYLKYLLGKDQPFDVGYYKQAQNAFKRSG